jgi:hypothetical protein
MPIEIKELHIKIVVGENGNTTSTPFTEDQIGKDVIIEACVEQVLEILAKKEER